MTTAIILIIIVLTMAQFHLKCTPMKSYCTLMSAVFATVIAFSYHETLAHVFISRGYGGGWAPAGCFLLVFVVGLAVFRSLADVLIRSEPDFGKHARQGAALVCGLLTGVFIAGNLLVVMGLMPTQHRLIYSRYPADQRINLNNPITPIIAVDGVVTGLYSWLSRGAMASDRSFAVVQADFLDRVHLNRRAVAEDVLPIASPECLSLPARNKRPVRIWSNSDRGEMTVVRVGIAARSIEDGGAQDETGRIRFMMGQLRLICKDTDDADDLRGAGQAVLPVGLLQYRNPDRPLDGKAFREFALADTIEPDDTLGVRDRRLWVDVAFEVPAGMKPVMFQFKQNAAISLIGFDPVESSTEIEQALDAPEEDNE